MGSFPGSFGNRGSGTKQAPSDEVRVTGFEPAATPALRAVSAALRRIKLQEAAGSRSYLPKPNKRGYLSIPSFIWSE